MCSVIITKLIDCFFICYNNNNIVIIIFLQASNQGALRLYERLGFLRDEKMMRYYLNSGDAYRLKLFVDPIVTESRDEIATAANTTTATTIENDKNVDDDVANEPTITSNESSGSMIMTSNNSNVTSNDSSDNNFINDVGNDVVNAIAAVSIVETESDRIN